MLKKMCQRIYCYIEHIVVEESMNTAYKLSSRVGGKFVPKNEGFSFIKDEESCARSRTPLSRNPNGEVISPNLLFLESSNHWSLRFLVYSYISICFCFRKSIVIFLLLITRLYIVNSVLHIFLMCFLSCGHLSLQ